MQKRELIQSKTQGLFAEVYLTTSLVAFYVQMECNWHTYLLSFIDKGSHQRINYMYLYPPNIPECSNKMPMVQLQSCLLFT